MNSNLSGTLQLSRAAALALALCAPASASQVGHLNDLTPNNTEWAASILLAGETPVHVNNITTVDLSTLDVLCINVGFTGPSPALLARVPELSAWVQGGGVLVYHDRSMLSTAILPGAGGVLFTTGATSDIDVVTGGSQVTDGPGGIVDDTTLDGWTATTIGFVANLPVGSINLLSNGPNPANSTGFIYPHGAGSVYYAAIPLDFYQAGLGPVEMQAAMSLVYAPNVVAYAAAGGGSPIELLCASEGGGCPCANTGATGHGCGNSAVPSGGSLLASGYASIGASTLEFSAGGLVPNQPGLFFQGDSALQGGSGAPFGDGLRCAGSGIVRLEVLSASSAGAASASVELVSAGGVAAGDARVYQLWYRDPVGSPCGTGFNLTNGVQVTWVP